MLEKIKAEIEQIEPYDLPCDKRTPEHIKDMALEIVEKYAEQEQTGHWILDETDNSITCDKCGCLIWANDISNGDAHYCPNCGARMVDPQESEEVCQN